MSQTSDSIHYTSETGIKLRQYPRQIFTFSQPSRPSETVVGGSDGLHLLKPRESILTKTSRDSPRSGESFDDQRSVEFHSIPPVSTVDGVHDKPRFSSLPIASSPARDIKTASIIRSNRPSHPIDADVIIKSDPSFQYFTIQKSSIHRCIRHQTITSRTSPANRFYSRRANPFTANQQ